MKSVKYVVAIVAAMSVLALSCASSGGGGAAKEEGPVVPVFVWNFDDPDAGALGWVPADSHWDYKGDVTVSRDDTTLGKPMLRVDLDYSGNSSSEWSEAKIRCPFPEPIEIGTVSRFNCDLYYNPEYKSRGSFKGKVFAMEGTREKSTAEASLKEEDAGNGWMKAKVTFRVLKAPGNMDATQLGIVGYKTNYKGPILLDNIYWD